MREILFRGKIIELCQYQGKWIEGFYGVDDGKPFIAVQKKNGLNGFFCDPQTVGQYTGMKDKSGKKIFEGDILKISFIKDVLKAVVKFGYYSQPDKILRTHLGFYFDFIDPIDSKLFKKDAGYWIGRTQSEIEVIGNVFDNSLEE